MKIANLTNSSKISPIRFGGNYANSSCASPTLHDSFLSKYETIKNKVSKAIEEYSQYIQYQEKENLVVFDEDGNVLEHILGSHSAIDDIPPTLLQSNYTFHHNHPNGSTLSANDVKTFVDYDLFQISTTDPCDGHFYMRKTPKTNSAKNNEALISIDKIGKEIDKYQDSLSYKLTICEKERKLGRFTGKLWTQFAKDFNYEYFHKEGNLLLIDFGKVESGLIRDLYASFKANIKQV